MNENKLIKIIDEIDEFIGSNPKVSKLLGITMILLFYTIGILTLLWYLKQI